MFPDPGSISTSPIQDQYHRIKGIAMRKKKPWGFISSLRCCESEREVEGLERKKRRVADRFKIKELSEEADAVRFHAPLPKVYNFE